MVRAMQSVTGAGRVVAGRYQLAGRIGHGAMGTVWRARDLVLGRDVAVKEVRGLAGIAERKVVQKRALREARVAARLSHQGLVTVHDVIEADGGIWIVMELVPSRSLARVLADDGPLTPARAAELGTMLADALGSAHSSGIVHRDVKPANVLLAHDGRAVLSDFGIATLNGDPGLTQAGMVMGTPGFCAPERIRGEPASPASDLWSLGATLFAAVEGHGPFESRDCPMAVLTHIVHSDPPQAASAGPLRPVIAALMSRDPADRPDASTAARLLAGAVDAGDGYPETGAAGSSPPPAGPVPAPAGPVLAKAAADTAGPVPVPAPSAFARAERAAAADATPIFEAVADSFNSADAASPVSRTGTAAPGPPARAASSPVPGPAASSPVPGPAASSPVPGAAASSPAPGAAVPVALRSPAPPEGTPQQRQGGPQAVPGIQPARAPRPGAQASSRLGPGRHRRKLLKGGDLLAVVLAAVACLAVAGGTAVSLALRQSARLTTGGAPSQKAGRGHRAVH
jgi:eukaryotic-like serine/threonine-protein kinase